MNGIYKNGERIYIENEGVLRVEVENSIVCVINKKLYGPTIMTDGDKAVKEVYGCNQVLLEQTGNNICLAPYGESITIDVTTQPGYRFLYWEHSIDGEKHARIYEKRHTFTIDNTYVSFVNRKPQYRCVTEKITTTNDINQTD